MLNPIIRGRCIHLAIAVAVLVGVTTAPGHAQEMGVVEGLITNGTTGATVPPGLQVRLDGFRTTERLPDRTTAASSSGGFRFEGLSTGSTYGYLVAVKYQGVQYTSNLIQFGNDNIADIELTVYEATHDDPGISLSSLTRLLRHGTADAVTVVEIADFTVPGDRVYVPGQKPNVPPPIRFAVPDGSFGLQPLNGFVANDLVIGGPGFAVFTPMFPGTTTLAYGYQLVLEGGEIKFTWSINRPTGVARLLSDPKTLEISVGGLTYLGHDTFADLRVQRWEYQTPPLNTVFEIGVRDVTVSGFVRTIRSTRSDRWAIISAGIGATVALSLTFWRRRWQRESSGEDLTEARRLASLIAIVDAGLATTPHASDLIEQRRELKMQLRAVLLHGPKVADSIRREISTGYSPKQYLR